MTAPRDATRKPKAHYALYGNACRPDGRDAVVQALRGSQSSGTSVKPRELGCSRSEVQRLQRQVADLKTQLSLVQLDADMAAAEQFQLREDAANAAAKALAERGRRHVPVLSPVSSCCSTQPQHKMHSSSIALTGGHCQPTSFAVMLLPDRSVLKARIQFALTPYRHNFHL